MIYSKGDYLFAFNFDPHASYEGYFIPCPEGRYQAVLSTDEECFGGHGRVDKNYVYTTQWSEKRTDCEDCFYAG